MRLIDADKLRFRHTVKCNSDTTRPYTLNCISFDEVQNAPTIKAVPINVLDKIRAEIEQAKTYTCKTEDGKEFTVSADSIVHPNDRFYTSGLDKALEIIDKYSGVRE